jgi:hypothetical protein
MLAVKWRQTADHLEQAIAGVRSRWDSHHTGRLRTATAAAACMRVLRRQVGPRLNGYRRRWRRR